MKSSKTLSGGAKLKFVNGVLFISSAQSTEWAKMYHLNHILDLDHSNY